MEKLVWNLSAALAAMLAIRLIASGLARQYPVLTVYLGFLPARSLLLMAVYDNDALYGWAYVLTLPVLSLLTAGLGLEIYKLVLEAYSGLSVLGRRSLAAALTVGGLIAFLTVQMGLRVPNEPYPTLRLFFLMDSWVSGVALLFLITLTFFVLWFPVPLKRNVAVYSFGLCARLVGVCAGYAVRVFAGAEYREMGGTVMMASDTLIFAVWLLAMTGAGEKRLPEGTIRRTAEERARLLEQLNSLNAMVRSAKNT